VPFTAGQTADIIGPTMRMAGWNAGAPPWVPATPWVPPPVGPGWPYPAVRANGAAYPPEIAFDGPRIVSEFLSGGFASAAVRTGLDRLEDELKRQGRALEARLGVAVLPNDAHWHFDDLWHALAVPGRAPGALRSARGAVEHHLLRDTLLDVLRTKGFALGQPVVPLGILPNNSFYEPIALGRHMKDVLIPQDHGEWTHLLQWFLIATASPLRDGNDAAKVFRYLGFQGMWQALEPWGAGAPRSGPNLWRVCCDRDAPYYHLHGSLARNIDDLRNPDMLNVGLAGYATNREDGLTAMLSPYGLGDARYASYSSALARWATNRERWPLLCAILRRKTVKRTPMFLQAERIKDDLTASVRAMLHTALATAPSVDIANSDLEAFFLAEFLDTRTPGPVLPHFQHLNAAPVLTAPEQNLLATQIDAIRLRYERYFDATNPYAIPYCWYRIHRADPKRMPAPPTTDTTIAADFENLTAVQQADVLACAGTEFRA